MDARGAAGAELGIPVGSTAAWLRAGSGWAPAPPQPGPRRPGLFRGPLTRTARALRAGELSMAHAAALAHGTSDLPTQVAAAAEPALVAAAARLDPPRLRRVLGHLQDDARSGDQRRADALVELARRALVGGQLPRAAGSDPTQW